MEIGDKVEIPKDGIKGTVTGMEADEKVVVTDEDGFDWTVPGEYVTPLPDLTETIAAYSRGKVRKGERSVEHKSKKQEETVVVDLHAERLIGNTSNWESADIKLHQLEKVRRTMRSHRKQKGLKIVFVHGKGDGKLREEVQKMLKKEFGCNPYDARYAEYGMQGATEVVVR